MPWGHLSSDGATPSNWASMDAVDAIAEAAILIDAPATSDHTPI
jgi:hypothetical protein